MLSNMYRIVSIMHMQQSSESYEWHTHLEFMKHFLQIYVSNLQQINTAVNSA